MTQKIFNMAGVVSGQNGKKPFTYCPGGINFNELKSPKMAKRIARHQAQKAQMETEQSEPDFAVGTLPTRSTPQPQQQINQTAQVCHSSQ